MNAEEFDTFLEETLERMRTVLASKGDEYVPGDVKSRFHNFDITAAFNSESSEEALWGFVSKQLVSLADMVKRDSTSYPLGVWDEKLGDVLNYMVLLRGIVHHKDKLKRSHLGIMTADELRETLGVKEMLSDPKPPAEGASETITVDAVIMHTGNPNVANVNAAIGMEGLAKGVTKPRVARFPDLSSYGS